MLPATAAVAACRRRAGALVALRAPAHGPARAAAGIRSGVAQGMTLMAVRTLRGEVRVAVHLPPSPPAIASGGVPAAGADAHEHGGGGAKVQRCLSRRRVGGARPRPPSIRAAVDRGSGGARSSRTVAPSAAPPLASPRGRSMSISSSTRRPAGRVDGVLEVETERVGDVELVHHEVPQPCADERAQRDEAAARRRHLLGKRQPRRGRPAARGAGAVVSRNSASTSPPDQRASPVHHATR